MVKFLIIPGKAAARRHPPTKNEAVLRLSLSFREGRPFPPLFSLLNPSFVHCRVKDGSQTPSIPPPLSNLQSLGLHHSQAARTCAQKGVGQTNTHARMCIIHYTRALADGEETRRSAATLVAFPVAVPHVMKVVGILLELFYV